MMSRMNRSSFVRLNPRCSLDENFSLLQTGSPLLIGSHNWSVGEVLPKVFLYAGWNESGIFLSFQVTEAESLRRFTALNDPVWRDSCVEFFIQPDVQKPFYCNFEFNSLGAFLSQSGTCREDRVFITAEEAQTVSRFVSYESKSEVVNGVFRFEANWNLQIFLPKALLENRGIALKSGNAYRCNFYKCGDDLHDPHFLSWNPVKTENPDFHCPFFFGEMELG